MNFENRSTLKDEYMAEFLNLNWNSKIDGEVVSIVSSMERIYLKFRNYISLWINFN